MTTEGRTVLAEFHPPGPADFDLPPIFGDVTKPMVLYVLSAVLIFGLFYAASRRAAVVPGKMQFAGEYAYNFVRNSIARDSIGSHDFMKFVPYLTALFFLILVNNFYGLVPLLQFPTFSHSGYAYALAALTWILYNGVGIAKHGFLGYFKLQSVPSGVTGVILVLIVPLEFMSNILVRPVTLALRLFANMFAGHLLLILFTLGGSYLVFDSGNLWYAPIGVIAWILAIAVSFLEALVMFLQAYVFTLLTAQYIGGALADEH
ncbi:F0F1 ATP synthase subunit A [Mumia qirimensis]|uniref:F0F1 ATP synthase subunit A n=1 Tax=Mumia qirimensis TaxID=3234852 RepID=UPI00351D194A